MDKIKSWCIYIKEMVLSGLGSLNAMITSLKQKIKNGKEVKFKKVDKKLVEVHPRAISQRTANLIFMGFILGLIGLASLTIISNSFRGRQQQEVKVTSKDTGRKISNQLTLFMSDFLVAYFANAEDLTSYYGPGIDIRNISVKEVESRLADMVVVEINDDLAVYQVGYEVLEGEEWIYKEVVINVPYKVVKNKYYVSDLPYFTNPSPDGYRADKVKGSFKLKDQSYEEKDYQNERQYVEAFFNAYASGDDTQLTPFGLKLKALKGYQLLSVDYYYFIEEAEQLVVVTQVTLTDDRGVSHSENFTLILEGNGEDNGTYHVKQMEHGISKKYQKEVK